MGIFDFGKPKWYKSLPKYFRPDESVIQVFENFRKRYSLDNNTFVKMISTTPWSVKKLQWYMLRKFRAEQPTWSEKEIWKSVLISRMNVKLMTVDYYPDFGTTPLSRVEVNNIINNAKSIIQNSEKFDDVIKYIVDIDVKENRFYDPTGVLNELNNLLENHCG